MSENDYKLIRSRRKSIAIYVLRGGQVEVRAPISVPKAQITEFVRSKQFWIQRKQREWQELPSPHQIEFTEGSEHFFLGEKYLLSLTGSDVEDFIIALNPRIHSPEHVERALDKWYRTQAQTIFNERHAYWSELLAPKGVPPSSLKLRKMRRRWGSCKTNGEITLNTELIKYPLECIDVVIVHELCHLLEFNHSKRFYSLMDRFYPQWNKYDQILKRLAYTY